MLTLDPKTRRFTVDEYYRVADTGLFENQRVELVDGEIIQMAPQRNDHAVAILLATDALRAVFEAGFSIRVQLPLRLGEMSEPEPDIAVVAGAPRDLKRHPSTALLVVEISDSTLEYDRTRKAALYAAAGIRDYWIINLTDRRLEVRRDPAKPGKSGAARYAKAVYFSEGQSIAPLANPKASLAVEDLLP